MCCTLSFFSGAGGEEQVLWEKEKFFRKKGIETIILTFRCDTSALFDYKPKRIEIVEASNSRLSRVLALRRKLRQIKPSFIVWSNLAQLTQLLSKTSLCALPSRVESFRLTIGEAMAVGVPTISTNVSSIPELITDSESDLLVPPENPEAMAEKILYALNNPSEMVKIAKAGRKRIKENFTLDKIKERNCAAYGSLLSSR